MEANESLTKQEAMDGNLAMANILEVNPDKIVEAAYLAGFEPSENVTTADEEINEAVEYLTNKELRL